MRITPVLAIALLFLFIATVARSAPEPPDSISHFPIRGQVLLIPIEFDRKPAYFILDTGAARNAVDEAIFKNLKVQDTIKLDTPNGAVRRQLCNPPDLRVGPFSLSNSGPVIRTDLAALRRVIGYPIIGVVGIPSFRKTIVQIDPEAQEWRVLPLSTSPTPQCGIPVDVETRDGIPFVHVKIGIVDESVYIDTGSNISLSLSAAEFDRVRPSTTRPAFPVHTVSFANDAEQSEMRA